MKRKQKKILLATLFSCAVCVGGFGVACQPQEPYVATVTGFDIPTVLNYYYGSCIDVLDPIVLDDLGNVLDVTGAVYTKDGDAVQTEYGKFFAEDWDGYTITYSVKTQDGVTHEKSSQINVVTATIDETIALKNVGEATTFDVLDVLSADQRAAMAAWQAYDGVKYTLTSKVSGKSWELSDTTVDFSIYPKSYYSFAIELPIGYPAQSEKMFACSVDFYNEADGVVWADDTLSMDYLFMKDSAMQGEIVTENLPTGAQATEYYRVQVGASAPNTQYYLFSVAGLHSKEYYQHWKDTGAAAFKEYTLKFDFYYRSETNTDSNSDGKYTYFQMNGTPNTHYFESTWVTLELTMDEVLKYMSAYNDPTNLYFDASYQETVNMVYSVSKTYEGYDIDGYVGNFRFADELNLSAVENPATALVDMKGKMSFDYTDLLDEEKQAEFARYEENYEIVWTLNGATVTDWTNVDGVYDVVATLKTGGEDVPVYKQTVDFYNSNDGYVWIDEISMDYLVLKTSKPTAEVVTANLPTGALADKYYRVSIEQTTPQTEFYVFSVKAKHSKAYYEKMLAEVTSAGKEYALKFDLYHTSATNGYTYSYFHINGTNGIAGAATVEIYEETWNTVTISLADLVKNYDAYADETNLTHDYSYQETANMVYSSSAQYDGWDIDGYYGNFRMVEV